MPALPELLHDLRPEAIAAIEAAQRGLDVAFARVGASDVRSKGGLDIVTGTDIAGEEAIKSVLIERSGYPVIGEESGGQAVAGAPCWLVDPICGTRNFSSQVPLFSVNIALIEGDRASCCAVGDGSTGEVYVAQRGAGAFSLRSGHTRRLRTGAESHTVVIEGWPSDREQRSRFADYLAAAVSSAKWEIRSFGTTLSLAYLAAGRVAGYALFSVSPVHTSAGALLVEEAGGRVTGFDGHPWTVSAESLLAAGNGELHAELLDLLQEYAQPNPRAR